MPRGEAPENCRGSWPCCCCLRGLLDRRWWIAQRRPVVSAHAATETGGDKSRNLLATTASGIFYASLTFCSVLFTTALTLPFL
jgi:hypothetical protein